MTGKNIKAHLCSLGSLHFQSFVSLVDLTKVSRHFYLLKKIRFFTFSVKRSGKRSTKRLKTKICNEPDIRNRPILGVLTVYTVLRPKMRLDQKETCEPMDLLHR